MKAIAHTKSDCPSFDELAAQDSAGQYAQSAWRKAQQHILHCVSISGTDFDKIGSSAEDETQTITTRLLSAIQKKRHIDNVGGWIYKSVQRRVSELQRQQARDAAQGLREASYDDIDGHMIGGREDTAMQYGKKHRQRKPPMQRTFDIEAFADIIVSTPEFLPEKHAVLKTLVGLCRRVERDAEMAALEHMNMKLEYVWHSAFIKKADQDVSVHADSSEHPVQKAAAAMKARVKEVEGLLGRDYDEGYLEFNISLPPAFHEYTLRQVREHVKSYLAALDAKALGMLWRQYVMQREAFLKHIKCPQSTQSGVAPLDGIADEGERMQQYIRRVKSQLGVRMTDEEIKAVTGLNSPRVAMGEAMKLWRKASGRAK